MFREKVLRASSLGEQRKSLGPVIVFSATAILTLISVIATVVSFSLCAVKEAASLVLTSLCLTLLSATISFVFFGLYLLAARRNEPVGRSRPPTSPIHSASFITMRLGLLLWIAAAIAALATIAGLPNCMTMGDLCLLQRIETAVCVLGSVTAATIVCTLENCDEPFKAPLILNIRPTVTCRVSYFDGILERSVSQRSSVDREEIRRQKGFPGFPIDEKQIKRKPVPQSPTRCTKASYSASTLVGSPSQSENFRKDLTWMPLMKEGGSEAEDSDQTRNHRRVSTSYYHEKEGKPFLKYSYLSRLAEPSPSGAFRAYLQDMTSGQGETGRAAPDSSISSSSQRSPLSTMRTIENPDLAIKPDLRFYPLAHSSLAARNVRRPVRDLPLARLPMAHTRSVQSQQLPVFQWQAQRTHVRGHHLAGSPLINSSTKILSNRQCAGYRMLSAYNEYQGVGGGEDVLAAHTRLIEESIVATVQRRMLEETRLKQRQPVGEKGRREHLPSGSVVGEPPVVDAGIWGTGDSPTLDEGSPHLPELDLGSCRLWEAVGGSGNEICGTK